jgi:hypothetical protein
VNKDAREIRIKRQWSRPSDRGKWRMLLDEAETLSEL